MDNDFRPRAKAHRQTARPHTAARVALKGADSPRSRSRGPVVCPAPRSDAGDPADKFARHGCGHTKQTRNPATAASSAITGLCASSSRKAPSGTIAAARKKIVAFVEVGVVDTNQAQSHTTGMAGLPIR